MSSTPAVPCDSFLCHTGNPGHLLCTRCKGAEPATLYCSLDCQKKMWRYHKRFCGKKAYTFDLTLLGSSNPVIKRTFDVPAWYTFKQLHYTIQYAMDSWEDTHLHEFSFAKDMVSKDPFDDAKEVLKIGTKDFDEEDDDTAFYRVSGMPQPRHVPKESEENLLLSDVFESDGRLRSLIAPDDQFLVLYYLYDFGDNWEHKLVFKGPKLARADRPLLSAASGCGPIEDSGAITGWDDVKSAFRSQNPTPEELQRKDWAQNFLGLGDEYSPFTEPNIIQMNYEGRWENYVSRIPGGFMGVPIVL